MTDDTERPWAEMEYPYHYGNYLNTTTRKSERRACVHCKPGVPCAKFRGTFDPVDGTDATCFIQWKGTDVCMDFHCPCGESSHIDAAFAYFVRCVGCGTVYEAGTQVRFKAVPPEVHEGATVVQDYDAPEENQ